MTDYVTCAESVLPLRVVPQPSPDVCAGGDCGACVLAGLTGLEVPEVYRRLHDGKVQTFDQGAMGRALHEPDFFDRCVEAPIGWPVNHVWAAWGMQPHHQNIEWFRYVRMGLDAGYYGVACVDFRKAGPLGMGTDHWVLLCGYRERRPSPGSGGGRVFTELLVSCSARSSPAEEWVDSHDFLRERGGFNLCLVRPRFNAGTLCGYSSP